MQSLSVHWVINHSINQKFTIQLTVKKPNFYPNNIELSKFKSITLISESRIYKKKDKHECVYSPELKLKAVRRTDLGLLKKADETTKIKVLESSILYMKDGVGVFSVVHQITRFGNPLAKKTKIGPSFK